MDTLGHLLALRRIGRSARSRPKMHMASLGTPGTIRSGVNRHKKGSRNCLKRGRSGVSTRLFANPARLNRVFHPVSFARRVLVWTLSRLFGQFLGDARGGIQHDARRVPEVLKRHHDLHAEFEKKRAAGKFTFAELGENEEDLDELET